MEAENKTLDHFKEVNDHQKLEEQKPEFNLLGTALNEI